MATWIRLQPPHSCYLRIMPSSSPSWRGRPATPIRCAPLSQGGDGACGDCNGKGWLLCDICQGQKTNVKSESNRIYRRCPACRAVGYVLCKKCKVFKCVTFPTPEDGEQLLF